MSTLKKPSHIDLSAIEELRGQTSPLYRQYPRQHQPQGAFIELDEYGFISASYNPEIGNAVPMYVWQRRTLRFGITPYLSGDEVADIIADEEVQNLLIRIHAGHEVRWDGSNHRGHLDGEAESALEELAEYLDRVEPSEQTAQAIMFDEHLPNLLRPQGFPDYGWSDANRSRGAGWCGAADLAILGSG